MGRMDGVAAASTTEPAADEVELLAARNGELDALFRISPAGPVPTGVLDGVAVLFPGSPLSRPMAALVRAVAWQGKVIRSDGTRLLNRITPLRIRAISEVAE